MSHAPPRYATASCNYQPQVSTLGKACRLLCLLLLALVVVHFNSRRSVGKRRGPGFCQPDSNIGVFCGQYMGPIRRLLPRFADLQPMPGITPNCRLVWPIAPLLGCARCTSADASTWPGRHRATAPTAGQFHRSSPALTHSCKSRLTPPVVRINTTLVSEELLIEIPLSFTSRDLRLVIFCLGFLCAFAQPAYLRSTAHKKHPPWVYRHTLGPGAGPAWRRGRTVAAGGGYSRFAAQRQLANSPATLPLPLRKERIAFTQPVIPRKRVHFAGQKRRMIVPAAADRRTLGIPETDDNGLQRFNLKQVSGPHHPGP